jgi:transposase, IS6 family
VESPLRRDPHAGSASGLGKRTGGNPDTAPQADSTEADHAQLKRRLRPMRGIKTMTGLRVVAAGHALVQNLRRGHYEIAADQARNLRLATAFGQLATAI